MVLGLLYGAGAVIFIFTMAWALTEMGVSVTETIGGTPDRSTYKEAMDFGTLPWLVGGFAAVATFLKELTD